MIASYVHHHGAGHARRAAALSTVLGAELVGFGSGPRPDGWVGGDWVRLPRDDDGVDGAAAEAARRHGAWNWVPSAHAGFAHRMGTLACWISDEQPAAVVVDVSAEVSALVTLLGVPTAAVLLHGERLDRPQLTAFDGADAVLAPWPASHRQPWHDRFGDRLVCTGSFGRFDGRTPAGPPVDDRVVFIGGTGGLDVTSADIAGAVAATPDWDWHVLGLDAPVPGASVHCWMDDPWPVISTGAVVVSAVGDATVAEVAAAGRPAVLVPQERPYDEQWTHARALAATGAPVVVADRWPEPSRWPALLRTAASFDGDRWSTQGDGGGAKRFADALAHLGRPGPVTAGP